MRRKYATQITLTWIMQGLAVVALIGTLFVGLWAWRNDLWWLWPVDAAAAVAQVYLIWRQYKLRKIWEELP